MSSKNTSPLLSVRPRSVLASRPPSLRGEAFGSNAWSGHRVRQGYGLLISLEWFHAAVPTPFVAKLRKPSVGLSANHHPMREDVKQKHFATPLRETSIGTCIQAPFASWRGFWF